MRNAPTANGHVKPAGWPFRFPTTVTVAKTCDHCGQPYIDRRSSCYDSRACATAAHRKRFKTEYGVPYNARHKLKKPRRRKSAA